MIASLPNQHCASAGKVCPGRLRIPWSIVTLDMRIRKGFPCKLMCSATLVRAAGEDSAAVRACAACIAPRCSSLQSVLVRRRHS